MPLMEMRSFVNGCWTHSPDWVNNGTKCGPDGYAQEAFLESRQDLVRSSCYAAWNRIEEWVMGPYKLSIDKYRPVGNLVSELMKLSNIKDKFQRLSSSFHLSPYRAYIQPVFLSVLNLFRCDLYDRYWSRRRLFSSVTWGQSRSIILGSSSTVLPQVRRRRCTRTLEHVHDVVL